MSILLNETKAEIVKDVTSSQDEQLLFVNYTVSNIDPQTNYILIVYLLDHLNNTKARNMFYFSEWMII